MGLETHQQLLESKVIFSLPSNDAVIGVSNITRSVLIDKVDMITGAAIVNGYLQMTVLYNTIAKKDAAGDKSNKENSNTDEKSDKDTTLEASSTSKDSSKTSKNSKEDSKSKEQDNNKKNEDKNNSKEESKPQQIQVDGVVRQANVWVPFEFVVLTPGVNKGDSYKKVSANIGKEVFEQIMLYDDDSEVVLEPGKTPFIVGLYERNLININIEV